MKKIFAFVFSIILIFICCSCATKNKGENIIYNTGEDLSEYFDSNLPSGKIEFTHSIMNREHFDRIIPLGQINPPGHTFPTDHIYFVLNGMERPIFAPIGGKILQIEKPGAYGDRAIRIGVTNTMTYYLGHIFIAPNLNVGDTVKSGAQIGTSGNTSCVDFGVINLNINNSFLSKKYPRTTLYGDKPLYYYNEPLRSELYKMVKPSQPPDDPDYVYNEGVTDGEFVFDKSGTLCGNWFLEGCFRSDGWYEWEDTLSFCYDVFYPDQIRIGIGKYSNAFAIKNESNTIRPENVTLSSKAVVYYLYNANNTNKGQPTGDRTGLMMVEMLSNTRIKLQIFEDMTSESREFTEAASIYIR